MSYTNLLTKITHVDHYLQIPSTCLCPAQEVLQARLEGADKSPECHCLWVGGSALLKLF